MSSAPNCSSEFTFKKNDEIGAAGAEDDSLYLPECFVDTGDLEVLLDCENPKRIIIGRTGAGKTALLTTIQNSREKVIEISPHSISLNFIANNNVIRFFEDNGVNLSPFYGLLWKHIFVVELLKAKYNIKTQESHRRCIQQLRDLLKKDHTKEMAVDYLENWGNQFWLTTEERIKELTHKIENKLSGSLEGATPGLKIKLNASQQLNDEEKIEVIERGKRAVSEVQIRELENMISILNDTVFTDRQEHFYFIIDKLDEEWTDEKIKYRLIKSLIDTLRRFKKIEKIKIIIALRQDLLEKVLNSTQDHGFQEEKYESLYLYIKWTKQQLRELIEKRINLLIKRRYTQKKINIEEIFPAKIDKEDPIDYIINRTFMRPRDAILFINDCISLSEGKPQITAATIKHAEEAYSNKRLISLATEWRTIYPNLKAVIELFHGYKDHFLVSDITKDTICEAYISVAEHIEDTSSDPLTAQLDKLFRDDGNFSSIRNIIIRALYYVGFLGIKRDGTSTVNWSYDSNISISTGNIKPSTKIYVHPMFYRSLGIRI